MTDRQIYIGKHDLGDLYAYLESGSREDSVRFIGMNVETYGTTNYFDNVQVVVNVFGLTILKDGAPWFEAVPIKNAFKSIRHNEVIIETEEDRIVFKEFITPISKTE